MLLLDIHCKENEAAHLIQTFWRYQESKEPGDEPQESGFRHQDGLILPCTELQFLPTGLLSQALDAHHPHLQVRGHTGEEF